MKHTLRFKATIDKASDRITVVASDETLDRHGDVLPIESWDLNRFIAAPRMLVDHSHRVEHIVGKWENVRIEERQLKMDAVFHDITPLAKAVKEMVETGFLDTVSVGFIPHGPDRDGGRETFELIETSWVTVPANPSATIENAIKSPISAEELMAVKSFFGLSKDADAVNDGLEDPALDDDADLPDEDAADDDADAVVPPADGEPDVTAIGEDDDEIADITEEGLAKLGLTVCRSEEDVAAWEAKWPAPGNDLVLCGSAFVRELLADREKLRNLTAGTGDKARKERIRREALKHAARVINDALAEVNRSS